MNSRYKPLLALGAGALAVIALVGYLSWSGYREAIRAAETNTRDYAAIFEARLDATLRHADAVLQKQAHQIPRTALDQQAVPRYARELNSTLDLEIINFTELAGIRITDTSGNILYTSDSANTPRAQVADRSYFRAVRDNPQVNLAFSEVITARTTGRRSVAVAKALRDEQGAFRGIVYVLLDLEHFLNLMKSLNLGANGTVAIRRSDDFTQVLRWPEAKGQVNMALPQNSPARATLADGTRTATIELTAFVDGIVRIYSYHTLRPYPFHIAVGIARSDALSGWRARSLVAGLSTFLLLGLLIGLLLRLERAHATHAKLAAIIDASNDAIVSRDSRGKILSWNHGAELLFGYNAAEIMGCDISVLVPPALRHELRIGQEAAPDFRARAHDSARLSKDGRIIDVSISAAAIRDATGRVNAIALIFRDITERKQAEAVRSQLASIIEQTNVAIFTRALDGTILSWNAGAERLLGYTAAETVGKSGVTFLPPNRPPNLAQYNAALLRGEAVAHESERLTKDGRVIPVLISHSPIRDGAGNIVGASVIQQDITMLKQAQAAVKESEERLRAIIENEPECVKVVSADGRLLEINQAGLAMIEADSLGQARGRYMRDLVAEDCRAAYVQLHARVMKGERGKLEFEIAGLKGGRRVLETHAAPLRDANGRITALLGITRDITESKQAEAARVSLEAQLRESQKLETIGTLAGGIAHDFNNIIATILGNTELARQDARANPQALESLEEIRKAGTRARNLVQQILAFSRRQPIERKPTALITVVDETVRLLRATLPARITLETHCEPDAPLVKADATLIEQTLINLATNATQAMNGQPGRIAIRLDTVMLNAALAEAHPALREMHAKHPGRTVRLALSDNGRGMDVVTMARVFEPFFSTKPAGEGTGLGLSVVYGIVQIHEGAIVAESQLGQGATFTLYLPLAEVGTAPEPDERIMTPRRALILGRGQHILYLDDDDALVFLVKRLLERRGYRVSAYTSQAEALAALRAEPGGFDLVVTDYNMPGMSGLDVAREVRAIRAELPVAVTSGFIDETLHAQALRAGARELIFKAAEVEEYCATIQGLAQSVVPGSLPH